MMKTVLIVCALLALGTQSQAAKVSPVQKVIELLEGLKGKVADDLAAEEKEMVEYTKYCDDESSERGYAISTATKAIERLNAAIEEGASKISVAEAEIASLSAEAAKKETELARAMELRGVERKEFKKTEQELVNAEDELQAAEVVIKKEMAATGAFIQFKGKRRMSPKAYEAIAKALSTVIDSTSVVNLKAKAKLQGFLQSEAAAQDEDKDLQMPASEAPEAKNYETHSGGVLSTIKDLEVKDEDQLSATRKSEMNEQHAFEMMKMSMDDAISILKKKIGDATSEKSALSEQAAQAEGEKAETEKTKAADEAFLKSLTTDCAATAKGWEDRKKSAADEMAAIDKAKEILATGVTAMLQVKKKGADDLAVEETAEDQEDAKREKIQTLLKNLSHKLNSFAMMELASAAGSDPFAKVKGLVSDMIAKLMDEAAQEADHKAFCDTELTKSRKAKDEKSRSMDQYRTRIDEAATTQAELKNHVSELQGEVAEIDQSQSAATQLRAEEHSTFLQASKDYKNSAEAVEKAMAVLSEYYGKSFVQVKAKQGKQPSFGSKTGGDTASTILGILEVSAEDFTKLLAETEASEAEAQTTYEKLTDDNKVSKASKLAEIRGKQSEIKSLSVALSHHNEDYKSVEKEYGAVMDYLDKLKPECETKVMSYAEKKARREAEIEGLQEALGIIEGTTIPSPETALIQRH